MITEEEAGSFVDSGRDDEVSVARCVSRSVVLANLSPGTYTTTQVDPAEAARGLETGTIGSLERIEGRYGGGVLFPGDSFLDMPLDINVNAHPQISVTSWVLVDERRDDSTYRSGGYIVGTGDSQNATPALRFRNTRIQANGGQQEVVNYAAEPLPVGEWVHVAAVWDYEARTIRTHVGDAVETRAGIERMAPDVLNANGRNQDPLPHPADSERNPARYVVVGASSLEGNRSVGWAGLDELRIYAGVLTPAEIKTIRESEEPAALGPVAPRAGDDIELIDWTLDEDYELSEVS